MIRVIGSAFILSLVTLSLSGQDEHIVSTPLESGIIRSGQRAGVWQYFDHPGILGLEIDYGTMQINYIRPDSSLYVVKEGDRWVKQRLKHPCRPHGSQMLLREHYASRVRAHNQLYSKANRKNKTVQTTLTFDISDDGTPSNPVVWGYKGFGMEKMLLSALSTAPGIWLPGVKMDGNQATCRFAIFVRICPDTCSRMPPPDTVSLLYGISHFGKGIRRPNPVSNEEAGMQFSPDNKWIAMGASLMANTGRNGILVMSTSSLGVRQITYGRVTNLYWTDNEHIDFKYLYSLSGFVNGRYDLNTNLVVSRTDSSTFFERLSPDRKTLCVARTRSRYSEVIAIDVATGNGQTIMQDPSANLHPLYWSPDQKAIIIKGQKDNMDILYHYDFISRKSRRLPIINGEPCGWSEDGSTIYVRRMSAYLRKGEIFSIDARTMAFSELIDKKDELLLADFSSKANQFMILVNDKLQLMAPVIDAKLHKIADNVTSATWNRDGTAIAYVSEKGTLLSLYDIQSGRSRIIHTQFKKK